MEISTRKIITREVQKTSTVWYTLIMVNNDVIQVRAKAARFIREFSYVDRFGNVRWFLPGNLYILGPKDKGSVLLKSGLLIKGAVAKGEPLVIPRDFFEEVDHILNIPVHSYYAR